MASYDIIVKAVDQTQRTFQSVEKGLKSIEAQSAKVNKALGDFGNILVAAVSSAAIGKVTSLAQEFGNLDVKLRASTGSGANSAATMRQVADIANTLGTNLQDTANAFSQLSANGLNPTSESLKQFQKLAIIGGSSLSQIADAMVNVYQGSFGKISKATDDMIQVEEKYGQYVVKIGGQVAGKVASTGQVVDLIKKYTNESTAFNDAFDASSKGVTAALNRLQTAITGNTGWGTLDKSIGGLIDRFTNFINGTDGVGKAIGYITKAVNFLGDNFETISTVVEVLGSIFLVGKLFQGLKLVGSLVINLGNSLRGLGYFFADFGSSFGALVTNLSKFWKSLVTQVTGAAQPLTGVFDAITRAVFVTLGTLVKSIGSIVKNLAAPFTVVITYISGLFDPLIDKLSGVWEWMKKVTGLGSSIPAPSGNISADVYNRTGVKPSDVQGGRGNVNPALVNSDLATPKGLSPLDEYLASFSENIAKAKREYDGLTALLAQTKDLNVASAIWKDLSSRAEQLGIVLEKNASLIQHDYAISVKKTTEELRQHEIELANTAVTSQKWANELKATNLQIYEQSLKLGDAVYMQKLMNQEIAQGNITLMEQSKRLANSEYQSDKFVQTINQLSLDAKQSAITLELLNAAYNAGQISLSNYAKKLGDIDANILGVNEKFLQLLDTLQKENKAYEDNFFVADQLNMAFAQGKINAEQYAKGVSQLGEEFFNATDLLNAHLITAQKAVIADEKQKSMLALLTEQFKAGAVSAAQFRKEAGALGQDSEKTDRMVNTYGKAIDLIKENNEALKKSIDSAATTFSKEFTDAFINMKNPLDAFKNMFTNILNDIATRIVKQHLADPMADLISNSLNEIMGTGGSGKGGVAQIMTEGATQGGEGMLDTFKTYGTKIMESMGGLGAGITNMFSGMGDGLMSIFGDVFNWISQNAGSLGSSLSGLLGSVGGMFGGGGGGFLGGIGDFFAGFFADGGTIPSGQFGITGEAGPELVTGPATVTPMNVDSVNSDSNGGLTVNFQLYAIDTQSGVQFLLQNKPAIISMVGEAYNKRGRRGPLD